MHLTATTMTVIRRTIYRANKRAQRELTVPERCESCDRAVKLEAHHADYSRPLQVAWLCHRCHSRLHAAIRRQIPKAKGAHVKKSRGRRTTVRDSAATVSQTVRSGPDTSRKRPRAASVAEPIREQAPIVAGGNRE